MTSKTEALEVLANTPLKAFTKRQRKKRLFTVQLRPSENSIIDNFFLDEEVKILPKNLERSKRSKKRVNRSKRTLRLKASEYNKYYVGKSLSAYTRTGLSIYVEDPKEGVRISDSAASTEPKSEPMSARNNNSRYSRAVRGGKNNRKTARKKRHMPMPA